MKLVSKKGTFKQVAKRDGRLADFNIDRIINAVSKSFSSSKESENIEKDAEFVAKNVVMQLSKAAKLAKDFVPSVEGIQDIVEGELMHGGFVSTAKHYILYRDDKAKRRKLEGEVPEHVRKLVKKSKSYFKNDLGEFTYFRSYSRWIPEENRRETWIETVNRYMDFMREKIGDRLSQKEYAEIKEAILHQDVMPSMRLIWSSGEAARKSNVTAFNCSFTAPTAFQDLSEIVYISCCGTGVGFSVEAENVEQFPRIKQFVQRKKLETYTIDDSKEGWADSLAYGMNMWYEGADVNFDYSAIRPAGAKLKTMGGRASGPDPLKRLLTFTRGIVLRRQRRRLTRLDLHDVSTMIGDIVVSGGVRRSALISLSDLDDVEMREAKSGYFFKTHPHRSMANNSAVYLGEPNDLDLMEEWLALAKSGSGERGIFNRGGLVKQMPPRRIKMWEDLGWIIDGQVVIQVGTNPCGEITLPPYSFCNLTESVCRKDDNLETLKRKTRIATILGTYQSMLTDFPYLNPKWKENCDRERLLGVSLTGVWDCDAARDPDVLRQLKAEAIAVNIEYAKRFGIPESVSITCVKPSGTVSTTVDTASGMHPRHSKFYIRRVRISASDPLFMMLKDQGLPCSPENGQTFDTATTFVIEFPVKAPEGSITRDDIRAADQLSHWKITKENYTEHNPSVTVSIENKDEWISTLFWVKKNWPIVGGLSFLPRDEIVYDQAPYEAIDEERYNQLMERFKNIDYSKIVTYEKDDTTQGSKELACTAGNCEI